MKQLKEGEPVIVLGNSTHGIALHAMGPHSPYSDRIIRVGSSATLHPNGQIDMHGTPSEEGIFDLRGHWLEEKGGDIKLLDPPKRPESLHWNSMSWRNIVSGLFNPEVTFFRREPIVMLVSSQHIIRFGKVLIACGWGSNTRIYHSDDVHNFKYGRPRGLLIREIPVNLSLAPVSP